MPIDVPIIVCWPRISNGEEIAFTRRSAMMPGPSGMGHADLDDRELIATEARHSVLGWAALRETLCDLVEELVAGRMTAEIIHVLEAVKIETEDRNRGAVALAPRQSLMQAIGEHAPVGE